MLKSKLWQTAAFAGFVLIGACGGSPEEKVANRLEEISRSWTDAKQIPSPSKRLKAFETVRDELEKVADKYAETSLGRTIAVGRAAGGVSPNDIKTAIERLAPRADCYSKPEIACLSQFTSVEYASGESSSNDPATLARAQVCSAGFPAAEQALAPIAINVPRYRSELVQLAYAAKGCSRPDDMITAVKAASRTLDATPLEQASFLLSILNTEDLSVSWPTAVERLNTLVGEDKVDKSTSANVALALAMHAANEGDSEAAYAKVSYVIDTLGYDVNITDRQEIAAALIMDGNSVEAFALAPHAGIADLFAFWSLESAVIQLATFDDTLGKGQNSIYGLYSASNQDIKRMLDAPEDKLEILSTLQSVETSMDEVLKRPKQSIARTEPNRVANAYATLAFGYERLGEAELADAALAKAHAAGTPSAEAEALISINRQKFAEAADLLRNTGYRLQIVPLLTYIAATGDASTALEISGRVGGDQSHNQAAIVKSLTEHGHDDLAHQVLVSMPAQSAQRQSLAWELAQSAAKGGNIEAFDKIVSEFSLEQSGYRYPLLIPLERANAFAKAGSKKKAEEALETAFLIGQKIDANAEEDSWGYRQDVFEAEEAARVAFDLGYTDLAFDLYQRADYKSYSPLTSAVQHIDGRENYTRILLAANAALDEEEESYVVNHLINKLRRED